MSDISVGSIGSSTNEFQSTALQNLDKDAFLQLLVAQMRYQNPLSPVDSNEYLAQAAQYASVEQLENMAQSQAELRSMQMVSIATDLVGKEVTAVNSFTGELVTGTVDGIRFGVEPVLIVDGVEVALSSVLSVGDVPGPAGSEPEDTIAAPEPTDNGEGNDTSTLEPPVGGDTGDGTTDIPEAGGGVTLDPALPTDSGPGSAGDPLPQTADTNPLIGDSTDDDTGGGSTSTLDPPTTAPARMQ